MSAPSARSPQPGPFCAAPWLESVLYNDGSHKICSRNTRAFGDWRQSPLEDTWQGGELRQFRREIAEGRHPDADCRACHLAGTAQNLARVLRTPLENALGVLTRGHFIRHEEYLELLGIRELFDSPARLDFFEERVRYFLFRFRLEGHAAQLPAMRKLENIVKVARAYWSGDEAPPVVAPFRQVQLIARCNARCGMCPGKFTGELENGSEISADELELAMARPQDIVDFFCNGSEFLLFKGWREVAEKLREGGVASLRLSTNGMLLTKPVTDYLVSQDLVGHLNVSLNAGTMETLERIQKNVRWHKLHENVEHLLRAADARGRYFPVSFSFIVMRSNFRELPAFLRLVAHWNRATKVLDPHAMIMGLENAAVPGYQEFLGEEHPSLADPGELSEVFAEAARIAEAEGIEAVLYNFGEARTLAALASARPAGRVRRDAASPAP